MLGAGKEKTVLENEIRRLQSLFYASPLVAEVKTDVAVLVDEVSRAPAVTRLLAALKFLVHQRGSFLQGLFDGRNRRQLFVVNLDSLQRLFGYFLLGGGHGSHDVSGVAHFIERDDRLVLDIRPVIRKSDFKVLPGQNGQDSWK